MSEINDLTEANRLIDYLTRFEDLMASLALAFIDATPETLDSEIDHALRHVADFADVRRSYLFLVNDNAGMVDHVHAWGDRDFRRDWSAGISLKRLAWLLPLLQNGQPVTVRVAELTEEARGEFGVKAEDTVMAAPLLAHEGIIGFIGMDWSGRESNAYDGKLLAQTGAFITGALERQRSEQAHSSDMKLMRALIDNVPDYLYAKDGESRFLISNYAIAQSVGVESPEVMRGKTDFSYFPEDLAAKYAADEQTVFDGAVIDIEEFVVRADGTPQWLHVTKTPYRDRQGNIVGLVGIGRDITERKRMDEALKTNERLMRTVIDNIPSIVYVKDAESRFLLGNKAIVRQLGFQSEPEILGKTDMELHPPELAEKYRADEVALMETGEPLLDHEEPSIHHETKTPIWLSTNKIPLRDDSGKVIGLVGINHDITERKQMEDEVKRKERLLRIVIDNLPSHIYVKDTQSRFILANRVSLQHMGANSEQDLLGKTDFDFHPSEYAEKFRAAEVALMESGEALLGHEEESIDHETNAPVWLHTNKIPLRDDSGKVIGLVGINHDITERKHAEDAMRQMTEELERRVEERTAEVKQAHEQYAQLQEQIIDAQKQAIRELSTPIIPILEQVIAMPLVGTVDSIRARDITRALLSAITQYRAKVVILDITGVAIVDTEVANHLNKTMQAARLKGAAIIVTGISDAVAETIVDLGIDWTAHDTLRDLQSGLRAALERMGYQWVRKS